MVTPPAAGPNADLLRATGRLLDMEGAVSAWVRARKPAAETVADGAYWTVSWCDAVGQPGELRYDKLGLAALRASARGERGEPAELHSGMRAELFRTLGQELDREGASLGSLTQADNGVHVTAFMGGDQISHYFAHDELEALSRQRRATRQRPVPKHPHGPLWFFKRAS